MGAVQEAPFRIQLLFGNGVGKIVDAGIASFKAQKHNGADQLTSGGQYIFLTDIGNRYPRSIGFRFPIAAVERGSLLLRLLGAVWHRQTDAV